MDCLYAKCKSIIRPLRFPTPWHISCLFHIFSPSFLPTVSVICALYVFNVFYLRFRWNIEHQTGHKWLLALSNPQLGPYPRSARWRWATDWSIIYFLWCHGVLAADSLIFWRSMVFWLADAHTFFRYPMCYWLRHGRIGKTGPPVSCSLTVCLVYSIFSIPSTFHPFHMSPHYFILNGPF